MFGDEKERILLLFILVVVIVGANAEVVLLHARRSMHAIVVEESDFGTMAMLKGLIYNQHKIFVPILISNKDREIMSLK